MASGDACQRRLSYCIYFEVMEVNSWDTMIYHEVHLHQTQWTIPKNCPFLTKLTMCSYIVSLQPLPRERSRQCLCFASIIPLFLQYWDVKVEKGKPKSHIYFVRCPAAIAASSVVSSSCATSTTSSSCLLDAAFSILAEARLTRGECRRLAGLVLRRGRRRRRRAT